MATSFLAAILLALPLPAGGAEPAPSASAAAPVDFVRDIQPIFAGRCHSCHGAEKQKGGLRLDRKREAFLGGDSGKAILPGRSEESRLIRNVAGLNPETIMPPKGERLSATEVARLRAWIDAGAPWPETSEPVNAGTERRAQQHWAFIAPKRAAVPAVKNAGWVRHPVDAFILAKLEAAGVRPAPEADRSTLIRRLSFDLTGLPPTPEEVAAFLKDTRPDAYERLVDRLLASPHFGERWGRHWLDLARYADSDGYEKDSVRPYAYLYRDWVIAAINRDLPFDRFTIEQLAGDLLPDATVEQKTATGFHRQTLTNKEGGVDQEEFRCKATVDRVNTTGSVWLGLTIGCAECHTHKYDPITQREFYQFYAFFNNASEKDIPAPRPDEAAAYERAMAAWRAEGDALQAALDEYLRSDFTAAQAKWEGNTRVSSTHWQRIEPTALRSAGGAALKLEPDAVIAASGKSPATDTYTVETEVAAAQVTGIRLEALVDSASGAGPGRVSHGNFVLSEFTVQAVNARGESQPVRLTNATADFAQKEYPVAGSIDGNRKTGWAISPQMGKPHVALFETAPPVAEGRLVFTLVQEYGRNHTLGRFRLSVTTSAPPFQLEVLPDHVARALRTPAGERTASQRSELAAFYRAEVDAGTLERRKRLAAHARNEPKPPDTKAATLVENEPPRKTHIHLRGDFLRRGDEVEPGVPAVLNPLRARGQKPDRLDLARWLFDPAQPLTGRVAVNHVWKHLFGRGLVNTVNDFGTRGEPPSHPELLDWLAMEFPRLGWSRKAFIKLLVTSAVYRQSSVPRPELFERDPSNLWLARQNRFRLEAESVRDVCLAVSGLLAPAIGGPSVRPPLPADIAAIGYANSIKWKESEGADRYRRGLYTFFQRTVPYPMLATFDAPDSNVTCTRRERSNTPLQALTLLNDPVFFECAQALGRQLAGSTDAGVPEVVQSAFQQCLARNPTPDELARLEAFFHLQARLARAQPDHAARLVGQTSSEGRDLSVAAAWVTVARTLMNLDEFVTRE